MSSFSSWTLPVVFEAYDFIFFFKWFLSFFSTYTFNASREKSGPLANKVSSLIKSIKSANSGSLTLCCRIDKTFLFHLSLAFSGRFDVSVQRISGEFKEFHCCWDSVLLLRNWRISDMMMNHQASIMANPWSPFYKLPIFYEGLHSIAPSKLALPYLMSTGCWMQCFIVFLASPSVYFKSRTNLPCGSSTFCSTASLNTDSGSPMDFLWMPQFSY